jgi:peptidoglycan/LPS O-acetylase OafA/YrhL
MSATVSPDVVVVQIPHVNEGAKKARRFGYQRSLDGMRAFAILLVMLLHTQAMANEPWPYFMGGYTGVDIFFVLSGFLITSLLLREWSAAGSINLKNFYMRRGLRLLPALVFALLTLAVAVKVFGLYLHVTTKTVLAALFYVSNWVLALDLMDLGALHHTWSLSIEEQFYLCWPLLLVAMLRARLRPRTILIALAATVAIVFVGRIVFWQGEAVSYDRFIHGLDTRSDSLLVGCALSVLLHYEMLPSGDRARTLYRVLGVVGCAFLVYWNAWTPSYTVFLAYGGCTAVAVSTAFVILALQFPVAAPVTLILESPVLVWLGRLSYSLYLWHYPLFIVSKQLAEWPLVVPVQFALSFAVATLSYYCVEKPFLKLKARYEAK